MFEIQLLDILKDFFDTDSVLFEERIGGDVKIIKYLFEIFLIEVLKDSSDIGKF